MTARSEISRRREIFLWAMLALYATARICQLGTDQTSTLLIVVLHVMPPALFALAHGSVLYQRKGIAVFALLCLGFGALAESISLRTGFPFGHYYFTDVMGPKVFDLPVMLALAYLGIGYVAWILGVLIVGQADKLLRGMRVVTLPLLAALIMVTWDLAMDPAWSTLAHAWIWQDGGAYFGVPASNFFGWFLTAYLYYQAFALYCRANPVPAVRSDRFWVPAILFYAVCALGNPLVLKLKLHITPPVVTDAAGIQWLSADLVNNCARVSLLIMLPFCLLAWLRLRHYLAGPQLHAGQPLSNTIFHAPSLSRRHTELKVPTRLPSPSSTGPEDKASVPDSSTSTVSGAHENGAFGPS